MLSRRVLLLRRLQPPQVSRRLLLENRSLRGPTLDAISLRVSASPDFALSIETRSLAPIAVLQSAINFALSGSQVHTIFSISSAVRMSIQAAGFRISASTRSIVRKSSSATDLTSDSSKAVTRECNVEVVEQTVVLQKQRSKAECRVQTFRQQCSHLITVVFPPQDLD